MMDKGPKKDPSYMHKMMNKGPKKDPSYTCINYCSGGFYPSRSTKCDLKRYQIQMQDAQMFKWYFKLPQLKCTSSSLVVGLNQGKTSILV